MQPGLPDWTGNLVQSGNTGVRGGKKKVFFFSYFYIVILTQISSPIWQHRNPDRQIGLEIWSNLATLAHTE